MKQFPGNLPVFLAFVFFFSFGPTICLFFFSGMEWVVMSAASIGIGILFGCKYLED